MPTSTDGSVVSSSGSADDLCTLTELKSHLGISGTSEDTLLQSLLTELSIYAQEVLMRGRYIRSATVTEYHDGDGSDRLYCRRRPLTAISALYEDEGGYYGQASGAFASDTQLTAGEDFAAPRLDESEENRGLIVALPALAARAFARGTDAAGVFPCGKGNIKATIVAGYSTVPPALVSAICMVVAAVRKGLSEGGIKTGETIGKYAYRLLGMDSGTPGDSTLLVAKMTFDRFANRPV